MARSRALLSTFGNRRRSSTAGLTRPSSSETSQICLTKRRETLPLPPFVSVHVASLVAPDVVHACTAPAAGGAHEALAAPLGADQGDS